MFGRRNGAPPRTDEGMVAPIHHRQRSQGGSPTGDRYFSRPFTTKDTFAVIR